MEDVFTRWAASNPIEIVEFLGAKPNDSPILEGLVCEPGDEDEGDAPDEEHCGDNTCKECNSTYGYVHGNDPDDEPDIDEPAGADDTPELEIIVAGDSPADPPPGGIYASSNNIKKNGNGIPLDKILPMPVTVRYMQARPLGELAMRLQYRLLGWAGYFSEAIHIATPHVTPEGTSFLNSLAGGSDEKYEEVTVVVGESGVHTLTFTSGITVDFIPHPGQGI
jgi:hypothetical protein